MPTETRPDDTGTRPVTPDRSPEEPAKKTLPLGLSLSQVVGGSLAAATAAALGSKLGVAGTIGGAALASVVSAVAGSLYTASVRRTRDGVAQAFSRRTRRLPDGPVRMTLTEEALTGGQAAVRPPSRRPDLRAADDTDELVRAWSAADGPTGPTPAPETGGRPRPRRVVRNAVIGAIAVFVLASVAIFGVESLTGRALDGDRGTTLGQLATSGSGSGQPTRRSETTTTSSSSPSSEPSASTEPSSTPSAISTPEPSSGTSTAPSTSPSDRPSASAGPSSAATPEPSASASASGSSGTGTNAG